MRIRLLQSISGINGSFAAGEETDWPDAKDAANLIKAGVAEKVGPERHLYRGLKAGPLIASVEELGLRNAPSLRVRFLHRQG